MLRRIYLLASKEIAHYFTSPLVYLLATFFLVLMGWLFFNSVVMSGESQYVTLTNAVIRPIYANMNFLFLIIVPLITMRSFAEERKEGTLTALFLSPLTNSEIVIGKFLGAYTVLLFMMVLTFIFPITLAFSGYSDWSIVISGHLGTLLNSLSYIAIGIFVSTLTENQIISGLISFCLLLFLMMVPYAQMIIPNFLVGQIISYLSMATHFEAFTRGVVRSDDILYFFSSAILFSYMGIKVLDLRRGA